MRLFCPLRESQTRAFPKCLFNNIQFDNGNTIVFLVIAPSLFLCIRKHYIMLFTHPGIIIVFPLIHFHEPLGFTLKHLIYFDRNWPIWHGNVFGAKYWPPSFGKRSLVSKITCFQDFMKPKLLLVIPQCIPQHPQYCINCFRRGKSESDPRHRISPERRLCKPHMPNPVKFRCPIWIPLKKSNFRKTPIVRVSCYDQPSLPYNLLSLDDQAERLPSVGYALRQERRADGGKCQSNQCLGTCGN